MTVHTLRMEDGWVEIAANITKGDPLDAGLQILGFCYSVNNLPVPVVLPRPEVIPTCRVSCPDGLVEAQNGEVLFVPSSGHSRIIDDPAALAAALAAVHEHMQTEPDPDEVERVVASIPASVPPDVAREAAAAILRRFTVEERAS